MNKQTSRTRNFADVIRQRLAADPALAEMVEEEAIGAHIATQIYSLRNDAGLTQKELADRVGMTQSVIARLEDADYTGHSLKTLQRIAKAFGRKIRVEFFGGCVMSATTIKTFEVKGKQEESPVSFQFELSANLVG